mmetsp:Transcript_27004/g.63400  ORF Transcript_27004/g.63400 Transcript_27004/m.63400 type:complete len:298 (+) Transcript_27004:25-918(+)
MVVVIRDGTSNSELHRLRSADRDPTLAGCVRGRSSRSPVLLGFLLFLPRDRVHPHGPAQVLVQQVARLDVAQGGQPVLLGVGGEGIQGVQQELDLGPLQAVLVLAKVARDDREPRQPGVLGDVLLHAGDQRPHHRQLAPPACVPGRHRLELADVQHVQHQRFQRVVGVVAEDQLVAAQLEGLRVQDPPAQPRAHGAEGLSGGGLVDDDRVRVLLDDLVVDAQLVEPLDEGRPFVSRLLLVDVDGRQPEIDADRPELLPQVHQEDQEGGRVLPARNADHDVVAVLQHFVVLGDGLELL